MRLNVKDGKVRFIMAADKDFVHNEMGVNAANSIIEKGEVTESNRFDGYPICVNNKFYFAAATAPKKKSKKTLSEVEPGDMPSEE